MEKGRTVRCNHCGFRFAMRANLVFAIEKCGICGKDVICINDTALDEISPKEDSDSPTLS